MQNLRRLVRLQLECSGDTVQKMTALVSHFGIVSWLFSLLTQMGSVFPLKWLCENCPAPPEQCCVPWVSVVFSIDAPQQHSVRALLRHLLQQNAQKVQRKRRKPTKGGCLMKGDLWGKERRQRKYWRKMKQTLWHWKIQGPNPPFHILNKTWHV